MSAQLLNEDSVVPYLESRGLISGKAEVEVLTGGVSCVVLAVKTKEQNLVLKQALPELKVATLWQADQRRAIVEARAMELLHKITPNSVPELIDLDPETFTLTMKRLPEDCTNWKVDMLAGTVHPKIGGKLGEILATWHNYGQSHKDAQDAFMEDSLFEQLRVTPFYRAVAEKNLPLQARINELITEITTAKITLVHGDFSPKNIMIDSKHDPIVLDFEVAHTGNPVFDLAFLSAHLLCKFLMKEDSSHKNKVSECALNFLASYSARSEIEISPNLVAHISLIARARVEGVSLVNYLDAPAQERVLIRTSEGLTNPELTFAELFS
jgi:5-methylthioribose kinase